MKSKIIFIPPRIRNNRLDITRLKMGNTKISIVCRYSRYNFPYSNIYTPIRRLLFEIGLINFTERLNFKRWVK